VGERLPVVIMCGKVADLDSVTTTANFSFSVVNPTTGLQFFATANAAAPATSFVLVNGRVTLWVTSNVAINNGQFAVKPDTTNTVVGSDPREKIYFVKPPVQIDSAFYYTNNGFGSVDRVEVYFKDTLAFLPDSMIFFWPSKAIAPINRVKVTSAAGGGMTLDAANKRHSTVLLTAAPFPREITSGNTNEFLGTSWNRPNSAPGSAAEATDFKIQERVGPLAMTALLVERIGGGAGTDTLFVSFSEPIVPTSLVGTSLLLFKKATGSETPLTVQSQIADPTATSPNRYKLVVAGPAAPALNDSLRLQPGGPITDATALLNTPHLNNRRIPIVIRTTPAPILGGYYEDRDADGNVDNVVIQFGKKVTLSDCVIALDWGLGKLDTAAVSRLTFLVPDSIVAINTISPTRLFTNLNGLKTSGAMKATVSYGSIPDEFVFGTMADSAAPVLKDTVRYYPGKPITETTSDLDTVIATFSESIASTINGTPFNLFSIAMIMPYTFTVAVPPQALDQDRVTLIVNNNSLSPATIGLPRTGDSVWINTAGGIADQATLKPQANLANRRVPLKVMLKPSLRIAISTNPFNETTPVIIDKFPSVTQLNKKGVAIILRPIGNMGNVSNITEANATIFDAVGNPVMLKTAFNKSIIDNIFYLIWNGCNSNGRAVGTGPYLAVLSYTDINGKTTRELKRIGVKR